MLKEINKTHCFPGVKAILALARNVSVFSVNDPICHQNKVREMQIARSLSFVGLVAAVLLVAAGGQFHLGILLGIMLTFMICLIEPSLA
jgi:hypothetical protein